MNNRKKIYFVTFTVFFLTQKKYSVRIGRPIKESSRKRWQSHKYPMFMHSHLIIWNPESVLKHHADKIVRRLPSTHFYKQAWLKKNFCETCPSAFFRAYTRRVLWKSGEWEKLRRRSLFASYFLWFINNGSRGF